MPHGMVPEDVASHDQAVAQPLRVPFNLPHRVGCETAYIEEAFAHGHLSGDGPFTHRCQDWLRDWSGAASALLTPSCTAALEMAALLADVGPGDEVVLPSFTFVTTATAFALRGATPVFVDVREDTLNLDPATVERAITPRTKVVVPVHYAGVACDMGDLAAIAAEHDLLLVEDAAQGIMASYEDRALGGLGDLGALSFHETKNVTCGEGGALLIREPELVERAEILREKGTNRASFSRGEVDKYTWLDIGSSFLLGELAAAFLWAQLERADATTARRLAVWDAYHSAFEALEETGAVRRPVVPAGRRHNAHMYYLLLHDGSDRPRVLSELSDRGIGAIFHYVPLHSSVGGRRYGRPCGSMAVTDDVSARLVRLPLWADMGEADIDAVVRAVHAVLGVEPPDCRPG